MIEKALLLAQQIQAEKIDKLTLSDLQQIIGFIDYTTLNDSDNQSSVLKWIDDSIELMNSVSQHFAAWCVFPEFIPLLIQRRDNPAISIAVVSGNFPSGKAMTQIKVEESVMSESMGADEIDVVINKGWALEGNFVKIEKEIRLIKGSLDAAHLKVIMETGLLDDHQIYECSKAAMKGGADFIKTSTGKIPEGASLKAIAIMSYAIKEFYKSSGRKVGIKPSGGITTPEEAIQYIKVVKEVLGEEWLNPSLFRIGASRLLSNSIQKINEGL